MNTINFAVIGQGYIGKRHAAMICQNSGARLVAVCDVLPQAQTGTADIEEPYYLDADAMLVVHPEIDVVCICLPNGLHAEYAIKVLDAGKHVLCEKPMALSTADCRAVIAAAKRAERQVFCVMQNRFSPPSAWLKQLVEQGTLGDIFMVQMNCYWNRDERYYKAGGWKGTLDLDGGTLFTQFSHFIDIMHWVFGDITDIRAQFADFTHAQLTEFEDSGIVQFKFTDGGLGSFNYSTATWDSNMESSLAVIGSKGSIKIGGQYMEKVEYCHIDNYAMPELPASRPANLYEGYQGSANNHDFVIQNVVAALNGQAEVATSDDEGLAVVDIIERIYALRDDALVRDAAATIELVA